MDIYCPVCGEPWENDTLHDYAEESESTYKAVYSKFFSDGCGEAFKTWGITCERNDANAGRAYISSVMHDLLGDDVDGIMSSMEDAEAWGLLD